MTNAKTGDIEDLSKHLEKLAGELSMSTEGVDSLWDYAESIGNGCTGSRARMPP